MDNSIQNQVTIFDTTLRDGEQAPGCSMDLSEKLRIAHQLAKLRVDVIEAGFPAASPGDFESVQSIASEVDGPVICGLARCHAPDIEQAAKALEPAGRKRIHVFLATSEIHRTHKLRMAKDEIIRRAIEGISMARQFCDDVEFSPEDASRTEPAFLKEVVTAAIEAGAKTINVPDTVGYTVPDEFFELFTYLKAEVPNINAAILSVHCHDDLGMAVANSLAAVRAGARQIECTINGIGERAGNCSLEEVVMALRTRADSFGLATHIDTKMLYRTSKLVSSITGMPIPRNKAIVGDNAFAHEAGIHQHGVLQHAETYEIMKPEDVGIQTNNLVLGKHSGKHAFRARVQSLGLDASQTTIDSAFIKFKELADQKKDIFDADLEALILNTPSLDAGPWSVHKMQVWTQSGQSSRATIELHHINGRRSVAEGSGDGPIAAAFNAIETATGAKITLKKFDVQSVTLGEDAQGQVTVIGEKDGRTHRGHGMSTDIIEASALAYVQMVNKISPRVTNQPARSSKPSAVPSLQTQGDML